MKTVLTALAIFLLLQNLVLAKEVEVPPFGKMGGLPLPLLGAILGIMDGTLNPCALAVLLFLAGYLLAIGSKKKCLVIGLVYSLTIFFVYSLFMYGTLSAILLIGYLYAVKMAVATILLIAGMLEIKDFFWYGKWFSLQIPKVAKPTIERLVKLATIPSAMLLGFFVSFVEIPCAGAFPLLYIAILAERVSGIARATYILWYNIFFILPLILLVIIFYLGLSKVERVEKLRVRKRRYMRLLSGLILLSVAVMMFAGVI